MGNVYCALDRLSGRQVALKRVYSATQSGRRDSLSDADIQLELAREFQALAALRHPNIISVLDYGFTQDHVPFFTMELIQGGRTILKAGSGLELADKADLLVQLLHALMDIHRHGIVHWDLKPSNVLVERQPQTGAPIIKVLDFGQSVPPGEVEAPRHGADHPRGFAPAAGRGARSGQPHRARRDQRPRRPRLDQLQSGRELHAQ